MNTILIRCTHNLPGCQTAEMPHSVAIPFHPTILLKQGWAQHYRGWTCPSCWKKGMESTIASQHEFDMLDRMIEEKRQAYCYAREEAALLERELTQYRSVRAAAVRFLGLDMPVEQEDDGA